MREPDCTEDVIGYTPKTSTCTFGLDAGMEERKEEWKNNAHCWLLIK